ncbi:carbohydrate kinase [uncultured Jatrophihabitans sp.]|uniref:carbohydrate kinase family protein n=1 Tax=uncultured Jatrophihabitans sp. TaxID=1610747 RepID=UPI0035CA573E
MTSTRGPVIGVLGEALIDLVENGDDEPRLARPGGSPYNVAIGLARLDRHAAFIGRLSQDPLGTLLRRHAERSDVDLTLTVPAREPTTVALVDLSAGIADYTFGIDGTADFVFTDAELDRVPATVDALHFGSLTSWTPPGDAAVERLVGALHGRLPISYDPNVRPRLQTDARLAREQVERSLAFADLVKTSEEDVAYLYPRRALDDVAHDWLDRGPSVVVVTRGGDGASGYCAGGGVARPVRSIAMVDTVGAGDAFMTGLLDGLVARQQLNTDGLAGLTPDGLGELLDDAGWVAAITCARAGANPPRRAELDAALRQGLRMS